MTGWRKRQVQDMAKEAGLRDWTCSGKYGCLDRFAELVRADEREVLAQSQPFQPDWANFEEGRKVGRAEALERPPNCGTGHCSCIECVMKPA
jgi:hypothetical protein